MQLIGGLLYLLVAYGLCFPRQMLRYTRGRKQHPELGWLDAEGWFIVFATMTIVEATMFGYLFLVTLVPLLPHGDHSITWRLLLESHLVTACVFAGMTLLYATVRSLLAPHPEDS